MSYRLPKYLVPALVLGCLAVGPLAAVHATGPPPSPARTVADEAGFFSKRAKEQANQEIVDIKKKYGRDLMIETFPSAPEDIEDVDLTEARAKRKFFVEWANRRAKNLLVNGVYVLICKKPSYVLATVGQGTRAKAFTSANVTTLGNLFYKYLKEKKNDESLIAGVTYVRDTMDKNLGGPVKKNSPVAGGRSTSTTPFGQTDRPKKKEEGMPIWGWICIGLVVLVVIWLVIAVIRALTAPRTGYGGPGYGGGGYGGGGYGGGGGGGGFFSSLLGGMFGAAAGMWMYNSFFGGHNSGGGYSGGAASAAEPGVTGADAADAGPSDVGGDYTAGGGGDFDGNNDAGGGGDFGGDDGGGGGGGDFGGGGGDFGGGGGDFGGGGGDFGGGGGDFGGGGGDF